MSTITWTRTAVPSTGRAPTVCWAGGSIASWHIRLLMLNEMAAEPSKIVGSDFFSFAAPLASPTVHNLERESAGDSEGDEGGNNSVP
jgi:hypothetical protein